VILLAGACAPADAGAPTERLREFFTRINGVLSDPATDGRPLERLEQIRRIVRDLADMRAAAADALAGAWDSRTPAERDEFVALFGEMLERAYVARFAGAVRGSGQIVPVYVDETVTGADAAVLTRLRSGGGELSVEYRMTSRDGRWRVTDVALDGVSTVANYRAQFRRLAAGGGHATLVHHLRAKLGEESLLFARTGVEPPASGAPPVPPLASRPLTPVVSSASVPTPPPAASITATPSPRPAAKAVAPAVRPVTVAVQAKPAVVAIAMLPVPRVPPPVRERAVAPPRAGRAPGMVISADTVPAPAHDLGQWLVACAFVFGTAAICRRWRTSAR
jgi:phospholipid transport system substrate-binding protein